MIVTKQLAQKYLIKKSCYIIQTSLNGDYQCTYASVHWKEGMEVFESMEQCCEEIDRLKKIKMDSGYCPRCNYSYIEETSKDLSYLNPIFLLKDTILYQCPSCTTGWYKPTSLTIALAYDGSLIEYVKEWAARKLQPSKAMETTLHEIKNRSLDNSHELYPVHAFFKNGSDNEYTFIQLQDYPPPASWFMKSNWHYLDQVTEIRLSAMAYPYAITKEIMKILHQGVCMEYACVRDTASLQVYEFDVHAGIFIPEALRGKSFEWARHLSSEDKKNKIRYYEPHERGGPDHWAFTPPPKAIKVWGSING